jgi:hypothetical protein
MTTGHGRTHRDLAREREPRGVERLERGQPSQWVNGEGRAAGPRTSAPEPAEAELRDMPAWQVAPDQKMQGSALAGQLRARMTSNVHRLQSATTLRGASTVW